MPSHRPRRFAADAEHNRAHEHAGKAGGDEETELGQVEKAGVAKGRAEVRDHENVVEVEPAAERDERDEAAVEAGKRKALEAPGDARVGC